MEMTSVSTNHESDEKDQPMSEKQNGLKTSASESKLPKVAMVDEDEGKIKKKKVTMSVELLDQNNNIPEYDRDGDVLAGSSSPDGLKSLLSQVPRPAHVTRVSCKLGAVLVLVATLMVGLLLLVASVYLSKGLHAMMEGA